MSGAMEGEDAQPGNPYTRDSFRGPAFVVPRPDLKVSSKLGGSPGIHLAVSSVDASFVGRLLPEQFLVAWEALRSTKSRPIGHQSQSKPNLENRTMLPRTSFSVSHSHADFSRTDKGTMELGPRVLSSTNPLIAAMKDLSPSKVAIKVGHDPCLPFLLIVIAKESETLCEFVLEEQFSHTVIRRRCSQVDPNSFCQLSLLAVQTILKRPLNGQRPRPEEYICSSWR